jgi:crossover junction endodeoxyribonuclease RuvC
MGSAARVIGIDPGTAVCGFGVIERASDGIRYLGSGTIRTNPTLGAPRRLKQIHEQLLDLIDAHRPETMSLERQFVAVNIQSAFRIGEARAVAMLAAAERGLELFEYAPAEVKLSVAAYGLAAKPQVKFMVRQALAIDDGVELADDAADALALALCHLTRSRIALAGRERTPGIRRAVRPAAGAIRK